MHFQNVVFFAGAATAVPLLGINLGTPSTSTSSTGISNDGNFGVTIGGLDFGLGSTSTPSTSSTTKTATTPATGIVSSVPSTSGATSSATTVVPSTSSASSTVAKTPATGTTTPATGATSAVTPSIVPSTPAVVPSTSSVTSSTPSVITVPSTSGATSAVPSTGSAASTVSSTTAKTPSTTPATGAVTSTGTGATTVVPSTGATTVPSTGTTVVPSTGSTTSTPSTTSSTTPATSSTPSSSSTSSSSTTTKPATATQANTIITDLNQFDAAVQQGVAALKLYVGGGTSGTQWTAVKTAGDNWQAAILKLIDDVQAMNGYGQFDSSFSTTIVNLIGGSITTDATNLYNSLATKEPLIVGSDSNSAAVKQNVHDALWYIREELKTICQALVPHIQPADYPALQTAGNAIYAAADKAIAAYT